MAAIAAPTTRPLPESSATSPAGFKFKDCDFCPPLVVVPNGEFHMGSNDHPHEKPAHKVRIPFPFAIGQYEVTYAEWDRCVDEGACRYRPEHQGSPSGAVGNLSWDDANTYLKWMSEKTGQIYRLPSEAEWEYAARAGATKRFRWGAEAGSGKANCADSVSGSNGQPAPVGSYKPNPFGLYDTAGNMAEWVEDCWNESILARRRMVRHGSRAIAACAVCAEARSETKPIIAGPRRALATTAMSVTKHTVSASSGSCAKQSSQKWLPGFAKKLCENK